MARRLMGLLIKRLSTERPAGQQAEMHEVRAYLHALEVDRMLGRAA